MMDIPTVAGPTVRVLVAFDVPLEQAADEADLIASVQSRLCDEAGYLDTGDPVLPSSVVTVALVHDDTPLNHDRLLGIYTVGCDDGPPEPTPLNPSYGEPYYGSH